jgi:hypothetical protein
MFLPFDNISEKEAQRLLRTVQIFAAISAVIVSAVSISQYFKSKEELAMARERHRIQMELTGLQVAALKKNS